jgi:hypothetical protein
LALLFSVRVSTGIQYQAVASLSPQLMSGFVLSIADIGLLIGLYHAPGTILAFPGGAIGAWLGDKPVALIGLALMAIGCRRAGRLAPAVPLRQPLSALRREAAWLVLAAYRNSDRIEATHLNRKYGRMTLLSPPTIRSAEKLQASLPSFVRV